VPKRIQRRRTKGWRLPAGAVVVSRPSLWGNPWSARELTWIAPERRREVAGEYAAIVLRGRDLACWCPLCDVHRDGLPLGVSCADCAPCHASVLLELSNA